MKLVVGGRSAGKRAFAAERWGFAPQEMADSVLDGRPVVYNAQRLAMACPEDLDFLAAELAKKDVVICDEVGSGVVPLERERRAGREAAGRLCILLAQQADEVVRVVCGLPMWLKGNREA